MLVNFKIAIKNLFIDYWGSISLVYILIITLISIFAYWISPDSSPNANQMNLNIHSKSPGFSSFILKIPKNILPILVDSSQKIGFISKDILSGACKGTKTYFKANTAYEQNKGASYFWDFGTDGAEDLGYNHHTSSKKKASYTCLKRLKGCIQQQQYTVITNFLPKPALALTPIRTVSYTHLTLPTILLV